MATEGYASSSAEKPAREMDDRPRLHNSLIGLRTFHQVRGELETAKNYLVELAAQARNCEEAAGQILGASDIKQLSESVERNGAPRGGP